MRLSNYFLPVLKETPADATIASHRFMLRAGMVKQDSAGIYIWLPLGFKVLKKIEQIVREEGQADAFLAANVMCHIPDIQGVVKGIRTLLKPTGVVMFEDPYLGDVIEKTSYDQIYDEHVFLFSAHSTHRESK